MSSWKLPYFRVVTAVFCLVIALSFFFYKGEKPLSFQRNFFDKTQYLFPKEEKQVEAFDLDVLEGAFIKSSGPPFLVSGKVLAVFGDSERGNEIEEYIVKEGDNLSTISEEFGISLETVLWANDLSRNSVLKVGQKLIILPVSGILHIIQKGDTLSGIAQIYKGKVDEIVAINGLSDSYDIFIGDLLIIPGGKMPPAPPQIFQTPLADSYFIFPCEGKITQGPHGPFGNAVDIGNSCGSPVAAAASGVVQRAGFTRIGGNLVTILHPNGVVTYYGHLSTISVRPGQEINTGSVIGYIGNTGYTLGATGCHLHFEVIGAKNFLNNYLVGSWLKWGNK